jgi:hypothetical protein
LSVGYTQRGSSLVPLTTLCPQWVKQGIPATGLVEGPGQDADGDGNIQIGGDGVVAKDVSGSIIAGRDINIELGSSKILEDIQSEIREFMNEMRAKIDAKIDEIGKSEFIEKRDNRIEYHRFLDVSKLKSRIETVRRTEEDATKLVVEIERRRLQECGREDLADRILLVNSQSDPYDVHSFDEDGTPRRIEIKASIKEFSKKEILEKYLHSKYIESTKIYGNTFLFAFVENLYRNPTIQYLRNPWDDDKRVATTVTVS